MELSSLKNFKTRRVFTGYLFCLAAIVFFVVFKYIPILSSFWLSLFDYQPASQTYIGLQNFKSLAKDPIFWQALLNTTLLVLAIGSVGTVLGYALALAFRGGMPGGKFFRTLFFLPVVTTITVIALVFRILYNPVGLGFSINGFLNLIGLPPQPFLSDEKQALVSVMIPLIWKIAAYNMIIFIAALDGIDPQIVEVADVEGASFSQKLRYVFLPCTRYSITIVVILAVMRTYRIFVPIYVMTFGDPNHATETITTWIYKKSFRFWEMGYGSAMSAVLFVIILALTVVQLRIGREKNV
jgi:multiple sugar transport system permease protein